MTFINPAILWGLAAISIPILIHIFNLRKTRKLEFSTLMFLKEIQQSRYKKIKLKQLLILLCRIAMIILLVLAFARPFMKGYLGFAAEKARSSVLLILDDSFSMETKDVNGSYFENAKKKIQETIDMLGDNDEVYYTTVSGITNSGNKLIYKDLNILKDTVSKAKVSDVTRNLDEVLYYANKILASSSNPYKEIFLFTDGQKSFMESKGNISTELQPDERTKLNIVLTGSRTGSNVSLDTINVVSKIFEKNKNIKLRCTIDNHNDFDIHNQSVVLDFFQGTGTQSSVKKYHDEKVIDVPANSSVETEFNFMPEVTGYAYGTVEIPVNGITEDEIPDDNTRYFVINIPQKIRLLIISHTSSDANYINFALSSSEELLKDSLHSGTNFFDIKQSGDNGLSNEDLTGYDCIVFIDKPAFTESEADKLYSFTQNGGGMIIYPGKDISVDNYNNILLHKLSLPPINGTFNANSGESYKFDQLDYKHPTLEDLFKERQLKSESYPGESPSITEGLNLSVEKNSSAVINLTGGKNFLVDYTSGRGHVLFYAVPPDMTESDFPKNNLFPVLTVRGILYLSNNNPIKEKVTGKDDYIDLSNFNLSKGKDSLLLYSADNPQGWNLDYINGALLEVPGNLLTKVTAYSLMNNGNVLMEFPCNYAKQESILNKYSASDISQLIKKNYHLDANIITSNEEYSASLTALRNGSELWRLFLIGAIIFLILEFIISKSAEAKKE